MRMGVNGGIRMLTCVAMLGGLDWSKARAQTAPAAPTVVDHPVINPGGGSADEHLTVTGRRNRFQPAPTPGAPMGPPPDKPAPHLGRYKISGDQSPKEGRDAQTGSYIAPFGTAYTNAGPVAGGLASRYQH